MFVPFNEVTQNGHCHWLWQKLPGNDQANHLYFNGFLRTDEVMSVETLYEIAFSTR